MVQILFYFLLSRLVFVIDQVPASIHVTFILCYSSNIVIYESLLISERNVVCEKVIGIANIDCLHNKDLNVIYEIKEINESLAAIVFLEIGSMSWENGRLIEWSLTAHLDIAHIPESIGDLINLSYLNLNHFIFHNPPLVQSHVPYPDL